jgi:uncharacterized delta-60 repeat protein
MSGGSVTLVGGAGANTYIINSTRNVIIDSGKGGVLMSSIAFDLNSPQVGGFNNLTYIGTDPATLNGNANGNLIIDNSAVIGEGDAPAGNTLVGGAGSDTLVAGGGNDLLFAGDATFDLGQLQAPAGVSLSGGVTVLKDDSFLVQGTTTDGMSMPVMIRYVKNGALDTAYGMGGIIAAPAGYAGGWANVIWPGNGVQPSLAGLQVHWTEAWNDQSTSQATTLAQYTVAGKIDTAFGNAGYLANGYPQALSDGSFVTTTTSNGVTSIQRFTKAGKSDATFGGGSGKLQAPSGVSLNGVTVLKDDSFIATGSTTDGVNTPVLVRYLEDGTLDEEYGTGGIITAPAGYEDGWPTVIWPNNPNSLPSLSGLQVRWSASIFDASGVYMTAQWCIARYTEDGEFDPTFGNNGYVADRGDDQFPQSLSDGAFLLPTPSEGDTSIQRFTKDGKPDMTFAGRLGELQAPVGVSLSQVDSVLKDDSFFVWGNTTDATRTPVLVRYLKNGTIDAAYGTGGVIKAPSGFDGGYAHVIWPGNGVQPSLAGLQVQWIGVWNEQSTNQATTLAQYTAAGKIDTAFGNDGYLANGYPQALSDGSFVMSTTSDGVTSILRFTKAGQLDLGFGSDTLGADSLVGGAGDDTLVSSAGVATLDGGAGNNTFYVNNSSVLVRQSTLNGDAGAVYTSVSYDLGRQATGVSTLVGTSPVGVTLRGNSLANSILGGTGNDTIFAGVGSTVSGGGGRDLYVVTDPSAQVIGNTLGGDTLQALVGYDLRQAENINNLFYTGTLGASLTGNGRAGSIIGGVGNDTLSDGGADPGETVTLVGGAGANTYVVDGTTNRIIDAGTGSVIRSSVSFDLGSSLVSGVNRLTYVGDTSGLLNGNSLGNLLVDMSTSSSTLVGDSGSDTLVAGDGGDLLFAGNATFDVGLLRTPNGVALDGGVTPLSDGSVLVTGTLSGGQLAAFRYTKAGLLDTAFGTGGYVVQSEGFTVDTLMGVSGGKVQAGGTDESGAGFVAQYTASGQLDTTFGTGGVITGVVRILPDSSFVTRGVDGGGNSFLTRYTSAGKPDTLAGANGVMKLPTGVSVADIQSPILQVLPDGGFLTGGINQDDYTAIFRYNKSGVLDTGYGVSGKSYYQTPFGVGLDAVQFLGDGSFLINEDNGLARYTPAGKADTVNGGAGGVLKAPAGYSVGSFQQSFADGSFIVSGMDPDSNPVTIRYLAGGKLDAAYATPDNPTYLADGSFLADSGNGLARFKANGQPDTAVGTNGVLKAPAGVTIGDIAISLADGSYLFNATDSSENGALVRYSKTFALDTAFGNGGYQTAPAGVSVETVIQIAGGKYQVAGTMDNGNGPKPYYAQYTATGQLDTTFGNGGILVAPAGKTLGDLSKLSDGGFLISVTDANNALSFVRYTATGQFDLSYGSDTLGADSLVGGSGDDTLVSSAGFATLDGGAGNNTYFVNNSSVVVRQNTLNGNSGVVYTSVSYDMSKQATSVSTLISGSATGVILTGNALACIIGGGMGNDSLIAGTGGATLQGFGQQGGVLQSSDFEADVMTGAGGTDTFVLGDTSGSFYLDSGGYSPGSASYAGISNFDLSKDRLVLAGSVSDYSAAFFKDVKAANTGSDLIAFNQEVKAFTAMTGITPSDKDIMLYRGDIVTGYADFIAGIRTTSNLNSAGDFLNQNRATFV